MASNDSLLDQVSKSDLDISVLLKLRAAIDDRINAKHRQLVQQLAAVEDVMAKIDAAASSSGSKRSRPVGKSTGGKRPARRARRTGGRSGAKAAGRHAGLSVVGAVQKVIQGKGGKASAAEIKKAFATAGDRRNLNFTLLVRGGGIKRVGFESKKAGVKGRAGGVYSVAS